MKLLGNERDKRNIIKQVSRDEYFLRRLPQGAAGCMLDIGAQVGLVSLQTRLFNNEIRIIAVEPEFETYAMLEDNVKDMDIVTHQFALGGGMWLTLAGRDERFTKGMEFRQVKPDEMIPAETATRAYRGQDGKQFIPTMPLSVMVQQFGINPKETLFKIDCEGGESILYANEPEIAVLKQAVLVGFELHTTDKVSVAQYRECFDKAMIASHAVYESGKCSDRIGHVVYVRRDVKLLY